MPTPIPAPEKAAFIAVVNVVNPQEAIHLTTALVNYEDIPWVIDRQIIEFTDNIQYLLAAITTLNQGFLTAASIYVNAALAVNVNDPVVWINSTTTSSITFTTNNPAFPVLGNSTINSIIVNAGIELGRLYIGPGSTVNVLDSTAAGAVVRDVRIRFVRSTPGSLNAVKYGSTVLNYRIDEGANFGGMETADPLGPCAIPVTAMAATEVTHNGVLISWTPPGSAYIAINIDYKKTNSKVWIPVSEEIGEFIADTGFIFRQLEADTYYDFRATVVCINGGTVSTQITALTVCCGAGAQLMLYKPCKVRVLIVASPNPAATITLCNGVTIPEEYPVGATLTIPYLAGKNLLTPFVVDNGNANDVAFNIATGEFNAAVSTLVSFIDGNIVEINAVLPA